MQYRRGDTGLVESTAYVVMVKWGAGGHQLGVQFYNGVSNVRCELYGCAACTVAFVCDSLSKHIRCVYRVVRKRAYLTVHELRADTPHAPSKAQEFPPGCLPIVSLQRAVRQPSPSLLPPSDSRHDPPIPPPRHAPKKTSSACRAPRCPAFGPTRFCGG